MKRTIFFLVATQSLSLISSTVDRAIVIPKSPELELKDPESLLKNEKEEKNRELLGENPGVESKDGSAGGASNTSLQIVGESSIAETNDAKTSLSLPQEVHPEDPKLTDKTSSLEKDVSQDSKSNAKYKENDKDFSTLSGEDLTNNITLDKNSKEDVSLDLNFDGQDAFGVSLSGMSPQELEDYKQKMKKVEESFDPKLRKQLLGEGDSFSSINEQSLTTASEEIHTGDLKDIFGGESNEMDLFTPSKLPIVSKSDSKPVPPPPKRESLASASISLPPMISSSSQFSNLHAVSPSQQQDIVNHSEDNYNKPPEMKKEEGSAPAEVEQKKSIFVAVNKRRNQQI